jgi:protein-tyrosine phosphatase
VIDIHSHLLPGVDDGSPSLEVSVPVLQRFERDGVEVLYCTPHLNASEAAKAPHEEYAAIFQDLVAAAPPKPALRLGWEIMLDVPGIDLTSPALGLGGAKVVLVEFPRMHVPSGASAELRRIRASGVVPVLAHPERYLGCTADRVVRWRNAGAVIQTDATILIGSGAASTFALQMLADGLIDVIASDNHGDLRSLASARDWLTEIGAPEQARLLTNTNAERLLRGDIVLPVPPVEMRKGVIARLKEIVFGRG